MRVSIVVTTYNRPSALARVLHALADQHSPALEVIIADDGSGNETRELVAQWQQGFPVPLHHVWQVDQGFRAAQVRNLAANEAGGDWLHFLDGDCVVRPSFVARIKRLAQPGQLLAGDRMLLSKQFTNRVEQDALPIHQWTVMQWLARRRRRDVNRLLPLIHWPYSFGRHARRFDWRQFRSANVGIAADDYQRLNGFEQEMVGWGLEDSEFAVRAINAGFSIASARLALGVFHLWHAESPRSSVARNDQILQQAITSKKIRAVSGMTELGKQ